MGNQQSSSIYKTVPSSPFMIKLRTTMKFNIHQNKTESFLTEEFEKNLKKISGNMSRISNPFCPFQIEAGRKSGQDQWMTCCLISPLIAIASPRVLCDDDSEYYRQSRLCGINKKGEKFTVEIKEVKVIEEYNISLFLLERPVTCLGWVGLTFFQNPEQINLEPAWVVNHPKKQFNEDNETTQYGQVIRRAVYSNQTNFIKTHRDIVGSIIFKIIQQKPYVVGIQINGSQGRFFDKQIFQKIQKGCKKLMEKVSERDVVQKISQKQSISETVELYTGVGDENNRY